MKKYIKIITLSVFVLLMSGCASKHRGIPLELIPKYNNSDGSKNLYVVDTIQIKEPVLLSVHDLIFIMPYDVYKEAKNKDREYFLNHKEVYLYDEYLPTDMIREIGSFVTVDDVFYDLINIPKEPLFYRCEETFADDPEQKNGRYYKFTKEPDYFFFVLIRGDYYGSCYNRFYESVSSSSIKYTGKGMSDNAYYKLVFSRCYSKK